jgi:hypothetical protein
MTTCRVLAAALTLLSTPLLAAAPVSARNGKTKIDAAALAVKTEPLAADGSYVLSQAEQKFDCKKLTGTMQIRILQLRAATTLAPTSEVSRSAQALAAPILGGTTHGTAPGSERARDVAMLHTYNRRLVEKGCPSYDLAKALSSNETPRPTVPGTRTKAKPAAAAAVPAAKPAPQGK